MEQKIKIAKHLIKKQLSNPIGMQAIAEQLNTSYHTFRKQFRRVEGISMIAYCQKTRLETAKRLLRDPEIFIFEVADAVGFSTDNNFTRWFKKYTGKSPTTYREQFY